MAGTKSVFINVHETYVVVFAGISAPNLFDVELNFVWLLHRNIAVVVEHVAGKRTNIERKETASTYS